MAAPGGATWARELILAGFVIATLAMLVVPLPTPLLDVLLATNISLAVVVLACVLYVPDALAIATFPTILLLTTLFRLALNVSSSRLILLQANAGEVINAFGRFVVRGNYVVGAIVFVILTIVQFIVIAKGSERVAEVGARFVLDAMPGKQMAIDAELRAGHIDSGEARRRRNKLSRESQFYGAMDGAMKFVKGDVIAAIIIAVVNALGGLAIGVLQKDMSAAAALKRYGLLSIGDGLVSQIPALIFSTAAGLLVTRTAAEDASRPLAGEIFDHLFSAPRPLAVAAAFVGLLAVVPGLPGVPFALLATCLGALAYRQSRARRAELEHETRTARGARPRSAGQAAHSSLAEWSLVLSSPIGEVDRAAIEVALADARTAVSSALGILIAPAHVHVESMHEGARTAVLCIREVPERSITVPERDPASAVRLLAENALRKRATDFVTIASTQTMLDALESENPSLVKNVVPKPVSITLLTEILRRLVEEGVSIRDLSQILEALAQLAAAEKDPLLLTEMLRSHMRRSLTYSLTAGRPSVDVITLDPILEDTIARALTRTPSGTFLSLAPQAARDIIAAVERAITDASRAQEGFRDRPVLLAAPHVRRFVKKLLESDVPNAVVVTYAELSPEVVLTPLGRARPN